MVPIRPSSKPRWLSIRRLAAALVHLAALALLGGCGALIIDPPHTVSMARFAQPAADRSENAQIAVSAAAGRVTSADSTTDSTYTGIIGGEASWILPLSDFYRFGVTATPFGIGPEAALRVATIGTTVFEIVHGAGLSILSSSSTTMAGIAPHGGLLVSTMAGSQPVFLGLDASWSKQWSKDRGEAGRWAKAGTLYVGAHGGASWKFDRFYVAPEICYQYADGPPSTAADAASNESHVTNNAHVVVVSMTVSTR